MKMAFSVPTKSAEERASLFNQFRAAGYEGLQLKKGQYQQFLDRPEGFVLESGGQVGAASGLIVGGELDDSGIIALRNLFGFAKSVGCERIIFCHLHTREGVTAADIKRFANLLSGLGKEAQQLGVNLSLHHHFDQPVMYRDDFDVFFDAVEDGSVGLTVDTAHLVKSGIDDLGGIIRDFADFIDNFHLKDFADGEFRVLGQGTLEFAPVFAGIRAIGFDGWLCADEESGGDIDETLDHSYQFIRSALDSAQVKAT